MISRASVKVGFMEGSNNNHIKSLRGSVIGASSIKYDNTNNGNSNNVTFYSKNNL
jgi:hypothetical protein